MRIDRASAPARWTQFSLGPFGNKGEQGRFAFCFVLHLFGSAKRGRWVPGSERTKILTDLRQPLQFVGGWRGLFRRLVSLGTFPCRRRNRPRWRGRFRSYRWRWRVGRGKGYARVGLLGIRVGGLRSWGTNSDEHRQHCDRYCEGKKNFGVHGANSFHIKCSTGLMGKQG